MGSRTKRARRAGIPTTRPAPTPESLLQPLPNASSPAVDPPVPPLTALDAAFGNISHLPRYDAIPSEFKRHDKTHVKFVSGWFFNGLKAEDLARLKPREGVDATAALRAIRAILGSFEPQHEHKKAGCAYLLSRWFELMPEERA